jgi:predicted PurR-regulated permease PerM
VPPDEAASRDRLTATWVELSIRLGILAFLLYWSFVLIRPFITIAIWAVVLTVALYPLYDWMVRLLGGHRRIAAVLLTLLTLLIVIGPAMWLVLGLIDSLRTISELFDPVTLTVPPPPATIKGWPLIGEAIYQYWELASSNLRAALVQTVPHLKPVGLALLQVAADAGTGAIKFFIAIIIAGFLYAPAPAMVEGLRRFSRRVASGRGEEFVQLAGATIRTVSRGVIGISALQAFLVGLGLIVAGVPGTSLITSAVLVLGIIQIGPSIVMIPLIIWSWFAMETTAALLFTAYMLPVNLLDNILRPFVMGRGLQTPMLVILIGVIGGTLSHGITGLFLGPIILAVIWELLVTWVKDSDHVPATDTPAKRE